MKTKIKYIVLVPALIVFWMVPLGLSTLSVDIFFVGSATVYLLFLAAALLCRLIGNIHAALLSTMLIGVAICVLQLWAFYDILPALLLCGWLRCLLEYERGNAVKVYAELYTDCIYLYFVAVVIRLVRYGYSFCEIRTSDIQTVPDICLMLFVLLLALMLFFFVESEQKKRRIPHEKRKEKKAKRSNQGIVGGVPVYLSSRTFFGFFCLLLAASLLQYTNGNLIVERDLYYRTGFRFLFFPWMVLLFLVLDALLTKTVLLKRYFRS